MSAYVGITPGEILSRIVARYFYGLRRTDEGELFLGKLDQLSTGSTISINNLGDLSENFTDFTEGTNYFDGRNPDHTLVFENLKYEQFLWENKNIFYYVDDEGELVIRINENYQYDDDISSDGTKG